MGYEGSILLSSGLNSPDTDAYFKRPARSVLALFGQQQAHDGAYYLSALLNRPLWGAALDETLEQLGFVFSKASGSPIFEEKITRLPFFDAGNGDRSIDNLWCLRKEDPTLTNGIALGDTSFRFYRGQYAVTRAICELDPLSYKILSGVQSVAEQDIEWQVEWNIAAVIAPHADVLLPKEKMTQDELWRRAMTHVPEVLRLSSKNYIIAPLTNRPTVQ